jgi:hypothetical protein
MKISKNQLRQIIQEELSGVLQEVQPTWDYDPKTGLKAGSPKPITSPYGMTQRQLAKLSAGELAQIQGMAAAEGAMMPVGKKVAGSGLKRALAAIGATMAGGVLIPAAITAATGAEIAGAAIDLGAGGTSAKVGKAKYSLGGSEEAAYNLAMQSRIEKGLPTPTYEEYQQVESGEVTPEEMKALMQSRGVEFPPANIEDAN